MKKPRHQPPEGRVYINVHIRAASRERMRRLCKLDGITQGALIDQLLAKATRRSA